MTKHERERSQGRRVVGGRPRVSVGMETLRSRAPELRRATRRRAERVQRRARRRRREGTAKGGASATHTSGARVAGANCAGTSVPRQSGCSCVSSSLSSLRQLTHEARAVQPGTFIIALTLGMTIAAKLEIYTQLICRAMPVEKSGVTLPPPVIEITDYSSPHVLRRAEPTTTGRILFEWSGAAVKEDLATAAAGNSSTSMPVLAPAPGAPVRTGNTWSKQCHKSSAVQSSVAQLVRPRFPPSSSRSLELRS